MASGIVGYAVLVVGDALAVYAVGVCFVGLAMSWGAPIQSRFMDQFAAADRSAGFGLGRTVYMTTGASGNVIVGALADLYGWDASFSVLAVIMAVVLGALAGNRLLGLGL